MKRFLFAVLALFGSLLCATAEVRLPDIMSSNMVLQQQSDATLWGYAEAGSKITIRPSWSKQVYTTQTSSEGEWMVKVATPKASNTPYTISVQEDKTTPTVIENVLIGEVWFCSGQSNMFMPLKGYTSQPVEGGVDMILNSGENKTVRVALISKRAALTPQEKVDGRWMECNPLNAQLFSATAYTFALQLNRVLDIPVGVITCSWGGSHAAGWMPKELLNELGYKDVDKHAANEKRGNGRPMVMYNGMLHPLRHYTIKGFLWYQGCSDVKEYHNYARYQSAMVAHWRDLWGLGELPFYFVEIAPYDYAPRKEYKGYMLREQQRLSLDMIPNSGMASTVDLLKPYETKVIHPSRKKEVGQRLAMLALQKTYKVPGIEGESPRFVGMEHRDNGEVVLSFTNCRGGFSTKGPVSGFVVAGEDRVFYPANVKILSQERKIALSCPEVKDIVAVRYLYDNVVFANLHNMWELPVLPFRTDDWEIE